MAENEIDRFISSSYEREKELNGELDYIHKLRHEMTELKADRNSLEKVDDMMTAYENSHISGEETLKRVLNIIRKR